MGREGSGSSKGTGWRNGDRMGTGTKLPRSRWKDAQSKGDREQGGRTHNGLSRLVAGGGLVTFKVTERGEKEKRKIILTIIITYIIYNSRIFLLFYLSHVLVNFSNSGLNNAGSLF